MKRMYTD